MGYTTSNISRALRPPPPPPPPSRPGPGYIAPRPQLRTFVPPPPWIFRHDPFLVLLAMEAPLLALLLVSFFV